MRLSPTGDGSLDFVRSDSQCALTSWRNRSTTTMTRSGQPLHASTSSRHWLPRSRRPPGTCPCSETNSDPTPTPSAMNTRG